MNLPRASAQYDVREQDQMRAALKDAVTLAELEGADLRLKSLTVSGAIVADGNVNLPLHNNGNSGTSFTVDWNNGNHQRLTLTGSVTLAFSNGKTGAAYVLEVIQGAGPYTITWPAAVAWPGGTAPTLTTTSGRADVFTFLFDDVPATDRYLGATMGLNYSL